MNRQIVDNMCELADNDFSVKIGCKGLICQQIINKETFSYV